MKTLDVDLGERSYPIFIGAGLLGRAGLVSSFIRGQQVLLVSNETVAPLYMERAESLFAGFQVQQAILPDGETYKTLGTLNTIYDALLEHRFNRTCTVVALGGGVVGDITGFAAATYQRGVDFVQIPTTLLAQVDSSVGGKTGVNHRLGKNMIGAFHQPRCVVADTAALGTLDDRQLAAGIAEVIKYGLIRDPGFFSWLEDNIEELVQRDAAALSYAIEQSCRNKAEVVAEDEHESGQRALLNLGHTFGHAIETGTGYGTWLHGEAVAVGMLLAARVSERQGWLGDEEVARIESLLIRAGLPTEPPQNMDTRRFLELMAVDKKVADSGLRLVLQKSIGHAVVTDRFDTHALHRTLDVVTGAT
jgi:3-dehydroquinate synthase